MPVDHSLTYKKKSLKSLPHRYRLKVIFGQLDRFSIKDDLFADVGCSNGFITNLITKKYAVKKPVGLEYVEEHVLAARKSYPHIRFDQINLNNDLPVKFKCQFDVITCFETLEHVGNLPQAISNLIEMGKSDARILITVPIEIGPWGITKYLLKRNVYKGYTLQELGVVKSRNYFSDLLRGKDISVYRDPSRPGWGTHFGFDYRRIDKLLADKNISFKAKNHFTTRFYAIKLGK
ncbi:hypothetical protein DCC81_01145 [Chitinophaga parva]|uniref:Methyltransferase domain-containing protein n=1 Tax=Chitinophaga parva TaxID=2169414 RepID=A0A2T7BKC0_9BACT|nr:methyltransferase domain-containing protein [Chitinophaga parva]PUZ28118.1 hypothetical protein DCC81_01145 [Chitinophaga parva]